MSPSKGRYFLTPSNTRSFVHRVSLTNKRMHISTACISDIGYSFCNIYACGIQAPWKVAGPNDISKVMVSVHHAPSDSFIPVLVLP